MSTRLTRTDSISSGDMFVTLNGDNQDYRAAAASVVLAWIEANYASPDPVTQKVTPADGFSIQVNNNSTSTWLLLRPPAAIATGEIILPLVTNAGDGQEVVVTTTKQIAALTINANGATEVNGAPSSLGADNSFRLRFDSTTSSWYKFG